MTALVIAEHDNGSIKGATLNAVSAALQCGAEVDVLVAGSFIFKNNHAIAISQLRNA